MGHLLEPYDDANATADRPPPQVPLSEIKVKRWQHDFWLKIIQAALDGHPDKVALNWHPQLSQPAAMRRSASSPQFLAWLDPWNAGKPYAQQIRPFGFLQAYTAKTGVFAPQSETALLNNPPTRGRPPKNHTPKPIAPYSRDPGRALGSVFDRLTGELLRPEQLKSCAEALVQYHLSPEDKFLNGQFLDRGRTERRHVVATDVVLIGKEANHVGDSGEEDPIWSAVEEFTPFSADAGPG